MSGFGSFLLGMGQGALRERERQEDMEDRKLRRELVRMQVDSAKQEKADKDALRSAGADVQPVEQTTTPVGQVADNGPNLPANPDPVTEYKVGDRFTYDAGEAQRMAAEQNTPMAKGKRMSAAMMKMGNASGALDLDDRLRKAADAMFNEGLSGLNNPDDLAKFVSDSQHDGMGGGLKIRAVYSPDKKRVSYHRVMPDGSEAPTGWEEDNTPDGLSKTKFRIGRSISIVDKLNFIRAEAEAKARQANSDRDYDLRRRAVAADELRASGAVEAKLPPAVKAQHDTIQEELKTIGGAIAKAQAEGTWDPVKSSALIERQRTLGIQARNLLKPYMNAGSGQQPKDPFNLFPQQGGAGAGGDGGSAPPTQGGRDTEASRIRLQEAGGDPSRVAAEIGRLKQALSQAKGEQRSILEQELRLWEGAASLAKPATKEPAPPAATSPAKASATSEAPSRTQLMRMASQYKPPAKPVDLAGMAAKPKAGNGLTPEELNALSQYIR